MAEAGGPATQAGIHYQNSVAALYLGRMLDLRARSVPNRVLRVRVEAPQDVDDIVIDMGDGSHRFVQAKLTISASSDTWKGLWSAFWRQLQRSEVEPEDRLVLAVGDDSALARDLRACSERTAGTATDEEYRTRLTDSQQRVVNAVMNALSGHSCDFACIRRLFSRVDVEIWPDASIERDYAPLWMPGSSTAPERLLGLFRDMAGGASRVRGSFDPAGLRARLKDEHAVEIKEPAGWGTAHYRKALLGKAVIEVPGTGVTKPITDSFIWPRASRYDRSRRSDFDDEIPLTHLAILSNPT
jgi:hypothetical protein